MSLNKRHKSFVYEDEELMSQFQKGNENAYIELVNRYRNKLINFVFGYLGDKELSEDVIQDTMLKLYQKRHYYREIAKFSTWIYTIARNTRIDWLRKQNRQNPDLLNAEDLYDERENPTPLSSLSQIRTKKLIAEHLSQLPVEQSEVLQLMYFQGQSGQQVANTLDLPLGTVKSRIRLAMNKMKLALAPLGDLGVLEGKNL